MARLQIRTVALCIAVTAVIGATTAYASAAPTADQNTVAPTLALAPPSKSPTPPPPPPPSPPPRTTEAATTCTYQGDIIPCHNTALGWWNGMDNCYWNALLPVPPAASPLWLGNLPADGNLYTTTCETSKGLGVGVAGTAVQFSSKQPPGYSGFAAGAPQLAALQLILTTGILGPDIHSAPKPIAGAPASVGLVGLPVWMWQTPSLLTWGPLNVGSSVGPLNLLGVVVPVIGVNIHALGAKTDWFMQSDNPLVPPVTCNTVGQPYPNPPVPGHTVSPNCGYVYTQPGLYNVIAATSWNVGWTAGANSGSLTITRYSTEQIRIGELQVVTQ